MKVSIPNDFSNEVEGRKCEWNFPDWKVIETPGMIYCTGPLAGTSQKAESSDSRCEECLLQEVCTRYVVDAFLWNPLPPKELFNGKSREVYRIKALESPDVDITGLRECNGDYPWDKWQEWRVWESDAFGISDPCISCVFHISCAVQALRKLWGHSWVEMTDEEFDTFSRERTLRYLKTGQ